MTPAQRPTRLGKSLAARWELRMRARPATWSDRLAYGALVCRAAIKPPGSVTDRDVSVIRRIWSPGPRVREDLARMDPRTRAIVALWMDGYRPEEITEMLGETSVRAVEGVLYRWRGKQSRLGKRGR